MDEILELIKTVGLTDPMITALVIVIAGVVYYALRDFKNHRQNHQYVNDVKKLAKRQRIAEKNLQQAKDKVDEWASRRGK